MLVMLTGSACKHRKAIFTAAGLYATSSDRSKAGPAPGGGRILGCGGGTEFWGKKDESHHISIEGELSEENSAEFEEAFCALQVELSGSTVLDMSAFDVTDGIGVAIAINTLRYLLERTERITLIAAPQLLAHNLYRVG